MRITVRAQGFELGPQLRRFAESRLLSSLSPLRSCIQLVIVRLEIRTREGYRTAYELRCGRDSSSFG